MPEPLDHLFIAGFTEARPFKSTLSVRKTPAPQRDREPHGQRLLNQLASLTADAAIIEQRRIELELPGRVGMTIAIEVTPFSFAHSSAVTMLGDPPEELITISRSPGWASDSSWKRKIWS